MVPFALCMKSYFYFSSFFKLMEICVIGEYSNVKLYPVQLLENRRSDIAPCVERMRRSFHVKDPLLDNMYLPFTRNIFCCNIGPCTLQNNNYLLLF